MNEERARLTRDITALDKRMAAINSESNSYAVYMLEKIELLKKLVALDPITAGEDDVST